MQSYSCHCSQVQMQWIFAIFIIYKKTLMYSNFTELQMIDQVRCKKDLFDKILDESESSLIPSSEEDSNVDVQNTMINLTHVVAQQKPVTSPNIKTSFCTCTKSQCQQKYCACYREGQKCGQGCACLGCKNKEFVPRRVRYIFGSATQFSLPPFSFSQ